MTSVETEFLSKVMAFPTAGINERIERLGLSASKFYFLLSSLLNKGLVSSSSVSTPQGRKRILRITGAGRQALGLSENPIPE